MSTIANPYYTVLVYAVRAAVELKNPRSGYFPICANDKIADVMHGRCTLPEFIDWVDTFDIQAWDDEQAKANDKRAKG